MQVLLIQNDRKETIIYYNSFPLPVKRFSL